jgi:O-antigen/teichoic acid export membrane protein
MSDIVQVSDLEQSLPPEVASPKGRTATLQSALFWDSISYFASKVVPGAMGLASVPVFIRMIGLDEYGRFAVVVPFLMAVAAASSGWLAQGVLRFHPAATDSRERQTVFDRAVRRGTIASVLLTSVLLAGAFSSQHVSLFTGLTSLAFCLSLLVYTVILARLQAQLRPGVVFRREIVRSVGGFAFPIVMVAVTRRKSFDLLVLGQALAYTIGFLPIIRDGTSAQTAAGAFDKSMSDSITTRSMIRQLWRFGWAVGLWLLLSQLLPVMDRWVIQRFASFSSAGVYASLYEIAIRSFSFLVFPITQAAHPRIMRSWNDGKVASAYKIVRHSILSQLIVFIAVFAGASVFGSRIVKLILGVDDPIATRMLPVLLVGGFLWQLALLLHKPLEIAQRTGAMLAAMAAVVVLNVASCFLFIPRFGYQAASYVLVFSACCYIAFTLCLTGFSAFRRTVPAGRLRIP